MTAVLFNSWAVSAAANAVEPDPRMRRSTLSSMCFATLQPSFRRRVVIAYFATSVLYPVFWAMAFAIASGDVLAES
jgi:hypothetical protein